MVYVGIIFSFFKSQMSRDCFTDVEATARWPLIQHGLAEKWAAHTFSFHFNLDERGREQMIDEDMLQGVCREGKM